MPKTPLLRDRFSEMVHERQDEICAALTQIDGKPFREDSWQRDAGGGGRTRVLQGGSVFDKAGVNVSVVHGKMPREAVGATGGGHRVVVDEPEISFFAAGISLVLHPASPMVPTAHANYRYFELGEPSDVKAWWFGGGADLTPNYLFEEDAVHYHQTHKQACDRFDPAYYPRFKAWCDEYFHIPHRNECRGVGGIFFDDLSGDQEQLFAFSTACSEAFLPAYLPIVRRRKDASFGEAEKRWQALRRGRYVEFNLVYDRGTSFGLRSGGRVESILMSLPTIARWEYDHQLAPDSREGKLVDALRQPRNWI